MLPVLFIGCSIIIPSSLASISLWVSSVSFYISHCRLNIFWQHQKGTLTETNWSQQNIFAMIVWLILGACPPTHTKIVCFCICIHSMIWCFVLPNVSFRWARLTAELSNVAQLSRTHRNGAKRNVQMANDSVLPYEFALMDHFSEQVCCACLFWNIWRWGGGRGRHCDIRAIYQTMLSVWYSGTIKVTTVTLMNGGHVVHTRNSPRWHAEHVGYSGSSKWFLCSLLLL